MNIAVFCSSSNRIADKYKQVAFRLGEMIAETGNALVFGGATGGLMDAVSEGAKSKGGRIVGVIPQTVIRMNRQSTICSELIIVKTMSERKSKMNNFADLFIVLPGSFGTLDEMLDVIASGIVGEHKKTLYIINQEGFYNQLLSQIDLMRTEQFIPEGENYKPEVCTDINHCMELIKSSVKHTQSHHT